MIKKSKFIFLATLILFFCLNACISERKNVATAKPWHKDLVPDEKTAISIAESIWLPIFGDKIYDQKPFLAYLIDDKIWLVSGTLKTEIGGVASIKIQKSDCKILEVAHGK